MQLVSFSVSNFRSITASTKILLKDKTIIIGKNNEGKSNLIKALNISMNILQDIRRYRRRPINQSRLHRRRRRRFRGGDNYYSWERDFPVQFQDRTNYLQSVFKLEFNLSPEERIDFKKETGSSLNGSLPLEIKVGKENKPAIKIVHKRGRGSTALNNKKEEISNFISERIKFNYIEAIRTDREAIDIIDDMLSDALEVIEDDPKFKEAIDIIIGLQKPILERLECEIKEPLEEFLPKIQDVKIDIPDADMMYSLRNSFDVIIDDGVPTNLEYKGDGVKSLASLALLKNQITTGCASIIAIEEPESHLHPGAIHQLIDVMNQLSNNHQVIISTHNPSFTDRKNISSNILIANGKAQPAKNIKQIRDTLGVKVSDNLVNANYVLIVEGSEDKKSLEAILSCNSEKLKKSLNENILVIQKLSGATRLPYTLSVLENSLCVYHVLLDNDSSAKNEVHNLSAKGLLNTKNYTVTACPNLKESEFEDCISPDIYIEEIEKEKGIRVNPEIFRKHIKWSKNIEVQFTNSGKIFTEQDKKDVKSIVSRCIVENVEQALHPINRKPIDLLIEVLETMIKI